VDWLVLVVALLVEVDVVAVVGAADVDGTVCSSSSGEYASAAT
jgi:hypothetical protein